MTNISMDNINTQVRLLYTSCNIALILFQDQNQIHVDIIIIINRETVSNWLLWERLVRSLICFCV